MRSDAISQPFGRRLHYTKDRIEAICHNALQSVGCIPSAPAPIEIELFVEKYFDCHVVYKDVDPSIIGFAAFDSQGKVREVGAAKRLFNDGQAGKRRAWATLAHEAGHGLLHGKLFVGDIEQHSLLDDHVHIKERRILCRQEDLDNRSVEYRGRWWEWQANQAIGGLLLPRSLVETVVKPFLEAAGTMGLLELPVSRQDQAIRRLADTFDVNPIVAKIRLAELYPQNEQPFL